MKLNRKISLATGLFTTTILLLIGLLVIQQWSSTLLTQLELASQDLAYTISEMEMVQTNLIRSNGSIPIQRRMEELRLATRIQYIYVIDKEGRYYSHTIPSKIGTREEDPFFLSILQSKYPRAKVRRTGTAHMPAVEATAPVFYQGEMAGIVVTGVLNGRMYQETSLNILTFCLIFIIAVFISLYSSEYLSFSIKKSMYGLEPKEISRLLGQRAMTLDNLTEAIITVDQNGLIIYSNSAAEELADITSGDLNMPIQNYYFKDGFEQCLTKNETIRMDLKTFSGINLHCRFEPILDSVTSEVVGATALMEDLATVRIRAEELTGIKQINEGLRAQNHEFLNKLHTISGLIQLEEYDEAIQYITGISHNRQEIIARLSSSIKDTAVAGLLLGKYNKAQEQKTAFLLEENSFLSADSGLSDTLNLILGNLLENSLEELAGVSGTAIIIKIREKEKTIQLQISDNGRGIPDLNKVFRRGFSTKGSGRGLGLSLISEKVNRMDGCISLHSEPGNTCFTIELPRQQQENS